MLSGWQRAWAAGLVLTAAAAAAAGLAPLSAVAAWGVGAALAGVALRRAVTGSGARRRLPAAARARDPLPPAGSDTSGAAPSEIGRTVALYGRPGLDAYLPGLAGPGELLRRRDMLPGRRRVGPAHLVARRGRVRARVRARCRTRLGCSAKQSGRTGPTRDRVDGKQDPPMGDGMTGMHHHGGAELGPFSLSSALTWSPDWVFLIASLAALALYGAGVVRLRRRGDGWPVGRSVGWLAGIGGVVLVTCTGLNDYGMVLFSAHMMQHMVLSMLVPILLLLGAPITLALRALRPAGKGRPRGPRELLVALLHSRYVRVISHPAFTIPLFIASLYGLYFTPLFDNLMQYRLGHIAMMVHFLAAGLLFFWPIMGIDPGPHRPGHVMRILELFMGMPFHAFFGVAVMMATHELVTSFTTAGAPPGTDLLEDQKLAGGITWAFGEIPTAIVLIALVFQWMKSEERQARRRDRAEERSGDAELTAYNEYLASLDRRGRRPAATAPAAAAPAGD